MKLSVACNFDPALLEGIKPYPVHEVYGKLSRDVAGGGRPTFTLPSVGKRRLAAYVALTRRAGLDFNYLLNASCFNNLEYTRAGQRRIRQLLDWLAEIGVAALTLNHPMLLRTVKRDYDFRIRIGVFAQVNSVQRAKFWVDEGADGICLDDISCNRDFPLLRGLRQAVKCDLQLLVNNACFMGCHMSPMHMNMAAHASQSGHGSKGFYLDYCTIRCTAAKVEAPVNFIRASWIRPEDLIHYQELGIDNFKIVERSCPTPMLLTRVKAYSEGRYDGNLLDLIMSNSRRENSPRKLLAMLGTFARPWLVNPIKMLLVRRFAREYDRMGAGDRVVVINNRELDCFLKPFLAESCRDKDCDACRYCHDVANRVVRIDEGFRQEFGDTVAPLVTALEKGGMWRYGKD